MSDIFKAIEKEKEYLSYRMKNQEPFHLVDAVKECGFASLNEYFQAKKNYQLSSLGYELIETEPLKAIADVLDSIAKKKTAVLFADTLFTLVWHGDNSEINLEYCVKHTIPVLPLQTSGGTIVSTVGDLNIGICVPQSIGVDASFLLNGFADIFRKYTDKTVTVDGNDVLVDGFKVMGSSTYHKFGMFMFITPVSLSEKSELIANICVKQSDKQPRHIDFMDGATLRREVRTWLNL